MLRIIGVVSLGKFCPFSPKFNLKKRKRNNLIDILKAGGTRIWLFLHFLKYGVDRKMSNPGFDYVDESGRGGRSATFNYGVEGKITSCGKFFL